MDSLASVGAAAPDFTLPDLEGHLHRLSDARGTIVVLTFWSAECPHSERVDRRIVQMSEQWGERVQVWWIAPNPNETVELLRRTAQARGIGPVLRDETQAAADLYIARTTPHLFVIDAQGMLCYAGAADDVTLGQRLPTRDYLGEVVEALLQGRPPERTSMPPFGCTIVRRSPAR